MTTIEKNRVQEANDLLDKLISEVEDLKQFALDVGFRCANPPADYGPGKTILESTEYRAYDKCQNTVLDLESDLKYVLNVLRNEEVIE